MDKNKRYVQRVIQNIGVDELGDRFDLKRIYGFNESDYIQLMNYEKSLIKPYVNKVFSTLDLYNFGTYDFQFQITKIQIIKVPDYGAHLLHIHEPSDIEDIRSVARHLLDIPLRIYIDILPGGLVDIDGDTYDVNIDLINDSDWGWEVENEIKDIMYDFLMLEIPFLKKSASYQTWEFYINYPE